MQAGGSMEFQWCMNGPLGGSWGSSVIYVTGEEETMGNVLMFSITSFLHFFFS